MRRSSTTSKHLGDEDRYLGEEPTGITIDSSNLDLIKAYNWYNYFYSSDDARRFVLDYLKKTNHADLPLDKVSLIKAIDLVNIGWNLRILSNGNSLPDQIVERSFGRLNILVSQIPDIIPDETVPVNGGMKHVLPCVVSELEEQIDVFYNTGDNDFAVEEWFEQKEISTPTAKTIRRVYCGLYSEIKEALRGDDVDLKNIYSHWKKSALKKFEDFIGRIITSAEKIMTDSKAGRKPRKRKEKSAEQLVSKLNYKKDHEGFTSANPIDIIGAQQIWIANINNRTLSVYNAEIQQEGLSLRGSTLMGYDKKTSCSKTLRKLEETLRGVISENKNALKTFMKGIKTKPKNVSGRINKDSLLLRIIK